MLLFQNLACPGSCRRVLMCFAIFGASSIWIGSLASAQSPPDWPVWRGPLSDGVSVEKNLPDGWKINSKYEGENLLWRKPEFASRSTPVAYAGNLYVVCRDKPETTQEGEKVVCIDAATGDLKWEHIHNVYLSDAPAERVGWSSVAADAESGNIYWLGLGCLFKCLNAESGELVWEHSMSEEYGMLSTYGGRTNFPVVFEDLVIISGVMTGWGDWAVPAHRYVAFDKYTGAAVWRLSTALRPEDTTYSTPVFTVINGQAVMVIGAGDGAIYGVQPRTGKVLWKYQASTRGINTTPLVVDGIVYTGHAEQNFADTSILGSIFAFDASQSGDITEDKLLWKINERAIGRSSPIKVGNRIYAIEDGGSLLVIDAATGEVIQDKKIGRVMFGSPIYGDGKIYACDNTGRFSVLRPTDDGVEVVSQTQLPRRAGEDEEVYGSPIIYRGKIYLPTTGALYCIGKADQQPEFDPIPEQPVETPVAKDQQIAQLQLAPVEMILAPGQRAKMQLRAYNANGQYLKLLGHDEAEWSFQGEGSVSEDMVFAAPSTDKAVTVLITAKIGEMSSTSRVRVIPPLPWSFDFSDKKVPETWIGASYRHVPKVLDGEDVLAKITTIPKGTRSQSWMGWTVLHDYTVEADFRGTEANGRMPDMGLINQRYTLDLQGSQKLEIRSWTSRLELRFAKSVPFSWQVDTWYRMKFRSETGSDGVTLKGKVWPRDEQEPDAWTIEATDTTPNRQGSPGMFGNAQAAEFYIDNVRVYANAD